jgi:hypothetical protein
MFSRISTLFLAFVFLFAANLAVATNPPATTTVTVTAVSGSDENFVDDKLIVLFFYSLRRPPQLLPANATPAPFSAATRSKRSVTLSSTTQA